MHILDIMQNSISAGSALTELYITENPALDVLSFTIKDCGKGMSPEFLKSVIDPFTTTRTTRKVGLGIPLLKYAAESTGGSFEINSEVGRGTTLTASFGYSHIDREPLGDMAETMHGIITAYEELDFIYRHETPKGTFELDTREIKRILDGASFKEPEILIWLLEYLREGEAEIFYAIN